VGVRHDNPFGPGLFRFLRAIARNNDKAWFDRHRDQYEDEVREPALVFIRMMAADLEKISPHLTARDRKVGGSLMRIHRDVRFSRDKRPFKTNVGIQFRHEAGKDVHAPGLYVHLEPKRCFLGCGMWRPASDALKAVRRSIVEEPKSWKRAIGGKRFVEHWELGGESLTRPPRGFAADHPLIEDLKRKDFIAFTEFADQEVLASAFPRSAAERFRAAKPFLRWQADALGLLF